MRRALVANLIQNEWPTQISFESLLLFLPDILDLVGGVSISSWILHVSPVVRNYTQLLSLLPLQKNLWIFLLRLQCLRSTVERDKSIGIYIAKNAQLTLTILIRFLFNIQFHIWLDWRAYLRLGAMTLINCLEIDLNREQCKLIVTNYTENIIDFIHLLSLISKNNKSFQTFTSIRINFFNDSLRGKWLTSFSLNSRTILLFITQV